MSTVLDAVKPAALGVSETWLPRRAADVVRQARTFVADWCQAWNLPPETADAAASCVAELANNAVGHAQWPENEALMRVRIIRTATTLTVEVEDPDPTCATVRHLDEAALLAAVSALDVGDDLHGLGLGSLVESLADLDYRPTDHGKVGRAVIELSTRGGAAC